MMLWSNQRHTHTRTGE